MEVLTVNKGRKGVHGGVTISLVGFCIQISVVEGRNLGSYRGSTDLLLHVGERNRVFREVLDRGRLERPEKRTGIEVGNVCRT